MITSSNFLCRERDANQVDDALVHAMSGYELSRVRTELYQLRIFLIVTPHPVQPNSEFFWPWPPWQFDVLDASPGAHTGAAMRTRRRSQHRPRRPQGLAEERLHGTQIRSKRLTLRFVSVPPFPILVLANGETLRRMVLGIVGDQIRRIGSAELCSLPVHPKVARALHLCWRKH
jgi:hypothetical protein